MTAGLGRRAIGHRLDAGRLHMVHRGVYAVGEGITRSRLEERFLPFLQRAGIERPELNVVIPAGDELMEVDCLWGTQWLIVELDSHATHATRAGFERDRVKDRLQLAHGWRVVRITWRELHLRPARLAADLQILLREVA